MNSITVCNSTLRLLSPNSFVSNQFCSSSCRSSWIIRRSNQLQFPFCPRRPLIVFARKRNPKSEPILEPSIVEEVFEDDNEQLLVEDFEDDDGQLIVEDFEDEDLLDDDDDFFSEERFEEEAELYVGDGSGGGGISLAGTPWDKKALEIAEETALSFNGELGIYAFRSLKNANVQVRVERLTNKSGSPTMEDIEAFSLAYRERLDEAESLGYIPDLSLEVSSPGVERVVRIPQDLDRFKDRPMYVKYVSEGNESDSPTEHDGIFRLVSFDIETNICTWGLADVRVNREKAGKGRPLSKKQKEWRLDTPFDSLRLVRLHSECK